MAAELLRVLNDLLFNDIKDPRLDGVSISAVEISGDVSVAKVFFSTLLPDADPEPVAEGLDKAKGYLRSRVAKALKIRHVPELRFSQDQSTKRGIELTRLIDAGAHTREDASEDLDSASPPADECPQ